MTVSAEFLGKLKFTEALQAQERAWQAVHSGGPGHILGFESQPVVTLGVRGQADLDLTVSEEEIAKRGYALLPVDRGGQATLHGPGQLVIFPVVNVRQIGARRWANHLAEVTRDVLGHWGIDSRWDECRPGLYTSRGKIVSMGLRLRQGISTHGIAINVSNDLADFQLIRPCGQSAAPMDRFSRPVPLGEVFALWLERFKR
jgi:lipoate-protein ligase B